MKRLVATTLLGLAVTSMPCLAQYTSGGNPAVPGTTTDGWYNFTVVDQNNPFSGDGLINDWQVYASTGGQVELVIVAPTTYDIVGESAVETVTSGLNTFTLSTPISVTTGDYIGFWEGDPSSVEYSYNGPDVFSGDTSHVALFTNNGSGQPTLPLSFVGSADREYSIYASTPEGGASWMYLLLAGATCLGEGLFASRDRLANRA
jgi:hypothetical protein